MQLKVSRMRNLEYLSNDRGTFTNFTENIVLLTYMCILVSCQGRKPKTKTIFITITKPLLVYELQKQDNCKSTVTRNFLIFW